jgi:SAM-dependent methyltransferase
MTRLMAQRGDEDLLAEHEWGSGSGPEFLGPRHAFREALIQRRLRRGVRSGHVLNAGAGGGSLTVALIRRGYRVTSIDTSAAFLAALREELSRLGAGDHPVLEADLTRLPFADDTFDGAVCGEVLEHIPDDVAALRELRRVLKPGGMLVATVPANPWLYDWFDKWVGHLRRYSKDGMEARLRAAGFEELDVAGWGFPVAGLYYRLGYRPFLRRRLRARQPVGPERSKAWKSGLLALFRVVLELDSLFVGRRPGFFALLVTARAGRRG